MIDDERRALVLKLAAQSGADPRTVERWIEGRPVNGVTDKALKSAVQQLGINMTDIRSTEERQSE